LAFLPFQLVPMMNACRACKSNRIRLLFIIADNRVWRCDDCSHVFLDAAHTPDTIREMYRDYEAPERDFYFDGVKGQVIENLDAYLSRCRDYCRSARRFLRLLDIGCGTGALLSRAAAQGFYCEGIEICSGLAHMARQHLGLKIHGDFLENLSLPHSSFDVVTMYDLIEHVPDPVRELQLACEILKPGGILFILTPNDDALMRRIARVAYRWTLRGLERPMRRLYYVHHLSYFTDRSLQRLATASGLEVVSMETRNQELSRLNLSSMERLGTRAIFGIADCHPRLGGKLLMWARKQ
jgi:2-polyprenyl-3-methyl-5-hydroxy-6-metoxy-1,4-benzoquinol methylase